MPEASLTTGTLYLIPTTLGNDDVKVFLPEHVINIIDSLDEFIVENAKTARQFLKQCSISKPQSQITVHELDKHASKFNQQEFFDSLLKGKNVGLMSEAGCPGIADPGAEVVAIAHQKSIKVVPLTGPSSILLALMASGLNGQQFYFHGYLPKEKGECIAAIKKMEQHSQKNNCTQIFIETPYRNQQLFQLLIETCQQQTKLCLAADINLSSEQIKTKTIAQWKKEKPDLNKKPCVFLVLW